MNIEQIQFWKYKSRNINRNTTNQKIQLGNTPRKIQFGKDNSKIRKYNRKNASRKNRNGKDSSNQYKSGTTNRTNKNRSESINRQKEVVEIQVREYESKKLLENTYQETQVGKQQFRTKSESTSRTNKKLENEVEQIQIEQIQIEKTQLVEYKTEIQI